MNVRTQGRTPITTLGARKKKPNSAAPGAAGAPRYPTPFPFDAADFVSDSGYQKVTVNHYLGTTAFLWQCFQQDGADCTMTAEGADRTANTLVLWFKTTYTRLTVIVF